MFELYPGSFEICVVGLPAFAETCVCAKRSCPLSVDAPTSAGDWPRCDVLGVIDTWNAAVRAELPNPVPAFISPIVHVTVRLLLSYVTPLPGAAATKFTYVGNDADTDALAMVFEVFVTVQRMVYVVVWPARGGIGPVFDSGPEKCSTWADNDTSEARCTCIDAADETCSGTLV